MSTGQVSKQLGRSRQGVINLARERKLRAVFTGAGWIYDPRSVEDFARQLTQVASVNFCKLVAR